jgi:hypothetical protein
MPNLSKLEIIDKVIAHFEKQRDFGFDRDKSRCCYRTADGKKCAVGCLIPDELYHHDMEGQTISAATWRGRLVIEALRQSGIDGDCLALLSNLQRRHDDLAEDVGIESYLVYLRQVREQNLTPPTP